MSSGEVGQVQIEEQVQRWCRCCCEMQVQRRGCEANPRRVRVLLSPSLCGHWVCVWGVGGGVCVFAGLLCQLSHNPKTPQAAC